jgi:hypothetical protein
MEVVWSREEKVAAKTSTAAFVLVGGTFQTPWWSVAFGLGTNGVSDVLVVTSSVA